jgi:hypothetical protein
VRVRRASRVSRIDRVDRVERVDRVSRVKRIRRVSRVDRFSCMVGIKRGVLTALKKAWRPLATAHQRSLQGRKGGQVRFSRLQQAS